MPQTPVQQRPPLRKAPRQARSAETVRVIVEAAARILEKGGLGGFTTNAVAERAGVSIGSLYQYFPGKDALIGALIVRETSLLIADWETSLAAPTGRAVLSRLISSAVKHQLRRPGLARLLDLEEARLPFDAATQNVTQRLRTILLDVLSRSDIRHQLDPDVAAQDVLAIIKGMVDAGGERGELDQENLGNRVSRAVHGYLDSDL
ncbi:TetR/AcrR family transcriptional regulator [Sphingomonas psychrotolerans]|uniref:TetR family transcriptional regulator n=1 Tax=Sphingomonas psychrotolerans TaxID=1327635 RepID=A0A2K8MJG3_9SPHN|nr:TetR/AcrR family transcriptional regulator [Sphingomonas psychrotolerans]ATY34032.1 TetR family transcriptional regulator [Sphingomonas psychrotolerans]